MKRLYSILTLILCFMVSASLAQNEDRQSGNKQQNKNSQDPKAYYFEYEVFPVVELDKTSRSTIEKATETIYFDYDKAALHKKDKEALDHLAAAIKDNKGYDIIINGYSDMAGPNDYNNALAEKRGKAVKQYLVSQGVDADRLEVLDYGELPRASKKPNKNRRVEFVVIKPYDFD